MKVYVWDDEKNKWLKKSRGISFEDVVIVINSKGVLDNVDHPNKDKYPNQRMWIVQLRGYAYLVPYVEDNEKYFLKTVVPSRKATKKYILKRKEHA